jgi:hypothetical protein
MDDNRKTGLVNAERAHHDLRRDIDTCREMIEETQTLLQETRNKLNREEVQ